MSSSSAPSNLVNPPKHPNLRPKILEEDFEACCICSEAPLEIVCCPECDNGPYCRTCFEMWMNKTNTCPTCKQQVSKMPGVNKVLLKQVLKYAAQCGHDGCEEQGTCEKMLNHMRICGKMEVACKNHSEGCPEFYEKRAIERHEKTCGFTRYQCSCGAFLLRLEAKEHETTCPNALASCDLCLKRLPRNQLPSHLVTSCIKRKVKCDNSDVGCEFSGTHEHYKNTHEKSCPYALVASGMRNHIELTKSLVQKLEQLEIASREQAKQIAAQNKQITNLLEQNKSHREAIRTLAESGAIPKQGELKVKMTVDFSKYEVGKFMFSEVVEAAGMKFKLKLYPKGRTASSNAWLGLCAQSFMGYQGFLVVCKFEVESIGPYITLFEKNTWYGNELDGEFMSQKGVKDLEFKAKVEILQVLMLGDDLEMINATHNRIMELEEQKNVALGLGVCTGTITGGDEKYTCYTCHANFLCGVCVKQCHQGHQVKSTGVSHLRCLCSTNCKCKVLPYAKLMMQ